MGKRIEIQEHDEEEALEEAYESDVVKRTHLQIVQLLRRGTTTQEVSEVVGYVEDWIGHITTRMVCLQ